MQRLYFPVLINEANRGYPLVLQLRAGNHHPGKGVAGSLRWLFWRLKRAFPGVRLVLRADAGFAFAVFSRVRHLIHPKFGHTFTLNFGRYKTINSDRE